MSENTQPRPDRTWRMPDHYLPMAGNPSVLGPYAWQNDQTGELPEAVHAFFRVGVPPPQLTPQRLELCRQYAQYYINAPCWCWSGEDLREASRLRSTIKTAFTFEQLFGWLEQALEITIDPF